MDKSEVEDWANKELTEALKDMITFGRCIYVDGKHVPYMSAVLTGSILHYV